MTRKMISAFLALVLCFGLVITVSAEAKAVDFVVDELGYLTDDEILALNALGSAYYDCYGVGIFFVFTQAESVDDYDVSQVLNGITDYVVMVENETHWYIHLGGKGECIDLAAEDALREAYNADETFVGGVGAYMDAAVAYFPELPAATESAAPAAGAACV